jgi:hypothetical protein
MIQIDTKNAITPGAATSGGTSKNGGIGYIQSTFINTCQAVGAQKMKFDQKTIKQKLMN